MKYISSVFLLSLISIICNAGQIDRLQDRFTIRTSNQLIEIPNYQVSKPIRDLTPEKLAAVLNSGSHYLRATELSDGSYALDMQGRLPGEGIAGATIGAFVGYVAVPAAIVIPTAVALYAAKAVVHIKAGPEAGDAFQKAVIDTTMPKVCEVAHRAAQVSSPTATVIGSFFTGPV
jgi:hypothetical protein